MARFRTFLPRLSNSSIAATGDDALSEQEQALLRLVTTDTRQGRAQVTLHPTLCEVAKARAIDFGTRGFDHHTDADGHSANWHVREAGYALPDWYGTEDDANNVESLTAGNPTAQDAWISWSGHPGHREHVLGLLPFYAAQTNVGVGYAQVEGSAHVHYWCFLSAPPE